MTQTCSLWLVKDVECKRVVVCSCDVDENDFSKFGFNHCWNVSESWREILCRSAEKKSVTYRTDIVLVLVFVICAMVLELESSTYA